jgi:hypothetical protein
LGDVSDRHTSGHDYEAVDVIPREPDVDQSCAASPGGFAQFLSEPSIIGRTKEASSMERRPDEVDQHQHVGVSEHDAPTSSQAVGRLRVLQPRAARILG